MTPSLDSAETPQGSTSARAVHREQVWAAVVRAVGVLLQEQLEEITRELSRAQQSGDDEWADRLIARRRLLSELEREVLSPPPS